MIEPNNGIYADRQKRCFATLRNTFGGGGAWRRNVHFGSVPDPKQSACRWSAATGSSRPTAALQPVMIDRPRCPVTEFERCQDSWLGGTGGRRQKPWGATFNALLNLLERFWKAMSPVSSTTASSSKCSLTRAIRSLSTWSSEWVTASVYSRATRSV